MSNKHLQRVTESVAYIGHASMRRPLPRHQANLESVHNHEHIITRLVSIALQYGAPLEKLGNLLSEAKYVTSVDRSALFAAGKHLQRGLT